MTTTNTIQAITTTYETWSRDDERRDILAQAQELANSTRTMVEIYDEDGIVLDAIAPMAEDDMPEPYGEDEE